MKVLIVDDQRLNLMIVSDILKELNYNVDTILCNKPEDVMGILETSEIDIILLDIVMPGITGIEILSQIRKIIKYKDIQIVMLTSLTDKEKFSQCFELGADDYILKPIELIEFKARFSAAIKKRKNILLYRDMYTTVKKQNEQLNILNKTLKETQFNMIQKEKMASIGELAAGVAHEINNPIGYVNSNIETLSKYVKKIKSMMDDYKAYIMSANALNKDEAEIELQKLNDKEAELSIDFIIDDIESLITDSKDGVDRVAKIVTSLRNFARTGYEEEIASNDINKIIEEALMIVNNEAKYTIDVEKVFGDIPNINCNKIQIGQVIVNLFINAIQAIKSQHRQDRGKIVVNTYMEDEYVFIKIRDDGPGIKKDIMSKIFDPFFTTKEIGQGTGLGLSISHDIIVNKHNGEILVESEVGNGTIFIIKLPYKNQD